MIRALKLCRWALPVLTMLLAFPSAHALDPNRMMSQYVRERWNVDRGLPSGHVLAIAQTPDGYLWIGTDNGLVRFDGFSFQPVSFFPVGLSSNSPVLGLTTDAEGSLVLRLAGAVVLLKSDGKFGSLSPDLGLTSSYVTAIWKEANGGVLFSDLVSGTVRLQGKRVEVLASTSRLPGAPLVTSLAETPDGRIWMGTIGAGLFYLTQGRVTRVTAGLPERKVNCILAGANNELWVGTDGGVFHWNGTAMERRTLPKSLDGIQVLTMLRDREFNIWVGTSRGLLRVNEKGVSFSDETALGTSGAVNALFEDREGNLWVGGTNGLERIRDSAFVTYSKTTGLPSEHNGPIYADEENRIWSGSTDGGLYWVAKDRQGTVREAGLEKDEVYSIAGQNGDIWIGRQHGGLTNLHYHGASLSSLTYTERNGLAQSSVFAVYQSKDRAVWAGTLSGGVNRFKEGRFTTYTSASGLASNTINSILETRDETMWFATSNGLSSLLKDQWKTITTAGGLPSATVNCLFEDSAAILWAGTSQGLAFLSAGRVHVPDVPELLRGQVFGIAEDKKGWFWIATANHVLAVRRDKLIAGKVEASDLREF
jgi:ligand-binding sensor domain-containing protein